MTIKSLEKQLKKLEKVAEKEERTAALKRKRKELKRKIRELKYRKYLRAGEKVRGGVGRLGSGAKKIWGKMKEMEEKDMKKRKKKAPQENYLDRLNKALS